MTDLAAAGGHIRAYLVPVWRRLHEADLAFHAIPALPDPLSTALCRHTTLFAQRALAAAGRPGWSTRNGAVATSGLPRLPAYASGRPEVPHCWLEHDGGLWLDLSADQFGLAPVLCAPPADPAFRHHAPRAGRPPLAALLRTIRNWEGDPRGTWAPERLAALRPGYEDLLARLRA